jgi:hypothetical protein
MGQLGDVLIAGGLVAILLFAQYVRHRVWSNPHHGRAMVRENFRLIGLLAVPTALLWVVYLLLYLNADQRGASDEAARGHSER